MISKSRLRADQEEEGEEEDWGDEIAGDSTDGADQESEGEDMLSIGSPTLAKK